MKEEIRLKTEMLKQTMVGKLITLSERGRIAIQSLITILRNIMTTAAADFP